MLNRELEESQSRNEANPDVEWQKNRQTGRSISLSISAEWKTFQRAV
jgi:hypothetical protein